MKREREEINVISFDADKVKIAEGGSSKVIIKQTNVVEVNNMLQLQEQIKKMKSILEWQGQEYSVNIPEVISWNEADGALTTKFFEGENLEIELRTRQDDSRGQYVDLSRAFIKWMKDSGIVWGDAAPRNILINSLARKICLVDFEKGCLLQDMPYTQDEFDSTIRGIVHEEFSAFLYPNEQLAVFGNIWEGDDKLVPSGYLRGKRERILYRKLFGEIQDKVSLMQAIYVQKLMSEVVTPYIINDETFFPLVYLAESDSPEAYVGLLLQLKKIDKTLWLGILSNKK